MNSKCEALHPDLEPLRHMIAEADAWVKSPKENYIRLTYAEWEKIRPHLSATPVPTPRAQMVTDAMVRLALHMCPTDLPHLDRCRWMAKHINAALSTQVVPDETGMGRARTADHAEEPWLDLSAFDGFTPGPWLLERLSGDFTYGVRVSGDCVSGYTALLRLDWPHADQRAELEANARLIAAAPLLLAELRRLRDVRASPEESHKGEPQP